VTEGLSDDLPDQHKICVYRIVQEALSNCSQHAGAKVVRIVVRQKGNRLQVGIEDDGKGFDPSRTRGLGLVGISERVSQLGGKFAVDSGPGRGTRLQVDLPLSNAPAAGEELAS
jgi:signal transduction histidine kinase